MNNHQVGGREGRPLLLKDPRLMLLFHREPDKCASLSEYAAASGIETGAIMELLGPALDEGVLGFEPVGSEIFIKTGFSGRPTPRHVSQVSPNLWERLRVHGDKHHAYQLWQTLRGLERAGWKVEANTARIMHALTHANIAAVPPLGLVIGNRVVPLIIRPEVEELSATTGRVAQLSYAGADIVAVICDSGALDENTTALRKLYLSNSAYKPVTLLCEAPRYNPVQLTPGDAGVGARSVTREALGVENK